MQIVRERGWGPDTSYNGIDAFVAKVNPTGSTLLYAGYIGGASDDAGYGIAVDAGGNAYLTGYTFSTEATFPDLVGPDGTYNGGGDAFVAKVSGDGAEAAACTTPPSGARRVQPGQPFSGTSASETIVGTDGPDTIRGGTGDDTIYGCGGDDRIEGEAGDDALDGGIGTDTCQGQADTDTATTCENTSTVP